MFGRREAYSELEEEEAERVLGLAVECKARIANEVATVTSVVVLVSTKGKAVAKRVEDQCTEAGIEQVLENNVLGVLGAHGANRELQGREVP